MAFCLPKFAVEEFKKKLKSGELNPTQLSKLSSAERRQLFSFMGEANAKQVNALFESKLLLKNQQLGMINWAKSVANLKPEVRRDILGKIERLEKALEPEEMSMFLEDLVESRLKIGVSAEEAGKILDFSKRIEEKKALISEDSPLRSPERLEYGIQLALFKEFVDDLKLKGESLRWKDYFTNPLEVVRGLAGVTKSLLSSLDNSFFGRQGIKVLFTNPDIWAKNFLKSWGDIGKELIGRDAMLPIRADVYSRPNALNNRYQKANLAVGLLTEEAFPSSLPTRIPILGRLFKASESAYNGAALRMRADLADRFLKKAEEQGVNLNDPVELQSIGKLTNSLTGRGSLGKAEATIDALNVAFFSVRFLKSNFDTLTAHLLDPKMSAFAKKQAATNLLKIVGSTAGVLFLAEQIWPGSVTGDPRNSNFGKIKINDTRFDVSGGMAGISTLAARLLPTKHNGDWGFWYQSSTSGKWTKLGGDEYGARNAMDVGYEFFEGKASPITRSLITLWKQKDFQGDKPTPLSLGKDLITPLPIITFEELQKNPNSAPVLASMILNGLGIGSNTYSQR